MYIVNAPKRAGFYPAAIYLCTFWYMPKDLAYRVSIFYCASALSGAFSGLLAAGIAQMHGIGGQEGWRWIFLLEGLATVVLGVMCFFLLIDSPRRSSKWLSPDEIRYLELQHFIKEGGDFKEQRKRVSWEELKTVLSNWRLYMLSYILLCQSAAAYGSLTPIICRVSHSSRNTQASNLPCLLSRRPWDLPIRTHSSWLRPRILRLPSPPFVPLNCPTTFTGECLSLRYH